MTSALELADVHFRYNTARRSDKSRWTLQGIDLQVQPGGAVGLVGESGSGKSTLVRLMCGLLQPGSGSARFFDQETAEWLSGSPREFRKRNQMVFQSPANSFDPRMRLGRSLAEPIRAIECRTPADEELIAALQKVGLGSSVLARYPRQLSGGQMQRVAIARALSVEPDVLYADEPTSALDVSVQAQVINLLLDLRRSLNLTLVVVSHDLAVVSRLCEQIVVLKDGQIAEAGPTAEVLQDPASDYTAKLIGAARAVNLERFQQTPGRGHRWTEEVRLGAALDT
ncbi:ABC transporter ATP-binding protein [Qaidamihabitans albus]|uniref:ABC transporter ATP-binding protein n=1 Tax=Qaidamihabitans albus TaxID=2795733 RepID=UPI0018F1A679|nr:dipeptide/oligopeptide/nickel ABC transporter ATP-binding protein [Qaidamihabitans albus]